MQDAIGFGAFEISSDGPPMLQLLAFPKQHQNYQRERKHQHRVVPRYVSGVLAQRPEGPQLESGCLEIRLFLQSPVDKQSCC